MSHISEYKVKAKNLKMLAGVCDKLGFAHRLSTNEKGLVVGNNIKVRQYARNVVDAAMEIKIPGWRYPVAVKQDGTVLYDHWGSEANTMGKLGGMLQEYNKEAILEEAWDTTNYTEKLDDGSVKITLEF